jgi:hypothetical protein
MVTRLPVIEPSLSFTSPRPTLDSPHHLQQALKTGPPCTPRDSPRYFQQTLKTGPPRLLHHCKSLDLERGILVHLSMHNLVNTDRSNTGQHTCTSREVICNFEGVREELDKLAVREALRENDVQISQGDIAGLVLYLLHQQRLQTHPVIISC